MNFLSFLRTNYKEALKFGFYDFQSTRDWYREVTTDVGMHRDLVLYWIRMASLLVTPIAPHFAEHIWTGILRETSSIQLALWPTPVIPIDATIIESGVYMRGTVKIIRDAEISFLRATAKAKGKKGAQEQKSFDPTKPKAVRVYVATQFPEWQDRCVDAVKQCYVKDEDRVDDLRVKQLLTESGLIRDKRAMPFIQLFKVN
jgi:leucyl-tRNA synthetase